MVLVILKLVVVDKNITRIFGEDGSGESLNDG